MCGSAFAQNTGAPANAQSDMSKPAVNNVEKGSMNNGATNNGTMNNNNTTGMANDNKGKPDKEMSKDGAPSAGSNDMMKK
jgi:hypothetical protein